MGAQVDVATDRFDGGRVCEYGAPSPTAPERAPVNRRRAVARAAQGSGYRTTEEPEQLPAFEVGGDQREDLQPIWPDRDGIDGPPEVTARLTQRPFAELPWLGYLETPAVPARRANEVAPVGSGWRESHAVMLSRGGPQAAPKNREDG